MNDVLSSGQIEDLLQIKQICDAMGTELVVIGATALLLHLGNLGRYTRDIDLVVALNLDEFGRLTAALIDAGWLPWPKQEHRWRTPRDTIVDLLPAGPELRRRGILTWPVSEFEMSLAGFEHVFTQAVAIPMSGGATFLVSPAIVTTLLKIHAYMESPHRREKDLQDIRMVLGCYEEQTDRIFSDEVFDAQLSEFEFTNAFLAGCDLRRLATPEDRDRVNAFIDRFLKQAEDDDVEDNPGKKAFYGQLRALRLGFMDR